MNFPKTTKAAISTKKIDGHYLKQGLAGLFSKGRDREHPTLDDNSHSYALCMWILT